MDTELKIRIRSVTLATYLIELGKEAKLTSDGQSPEGQPLAAWEFPPHDDVREAIATFEANESLVEPRAYYRAVKRVRSEMFEYLGIGNATSS
jgi:hypothetical protein